MKREGLCDARQVRIRGQVEHELAAGLQCGQVEVELRGPGGAIILRCPARIAFAKVEQHDPLGLVVQLDACLSIEAPEPNHETTERAIERVRDHSDVRAGRPQWKEPRLKTQKDLARQARNAGILEAHDAGQSQGSIARRLGLCRASVSAIVRRDRQMREASEQ